MFHRHPGWRYDMETVSVLLALCEGKPSVIQAGGLPSQRASNTGFDVFCPNEPRKTVELPVNWNAIIIMWCHCNFFGMGLLNIFSHGRNVFLIIERLQTRFVFRRGHRSVTVVTLVTYIPWVTPLYFMYEPKCSTTFPWCTINDPEALAWCTNHFVHKVEFSYIGWTEFTHCDIDTIQWIWSISIFQKGWEFVILKKIALTFALSNT